MLDRRPPAAGGPGDRHDVEPRRIFQQAVPLHEGHGQARQPPLLHRVHGIGRMADFGGSTSLDLDEDDRPAVKRHEIEFARRQPAAAGEFKGVGSL